MTVQTKAPESQFAYVVLAARRAGAGADYEPSDCGTTAGGKTCESLKATRTPAEEVPSGFD